jgi:glucan phosphorylase
MDSFTSLGIPATGYSIRYEFGIFKQKIIDGWQMEFPDDWLNLADVWLNQRADESVEVKFGGYVETVWDGKKNNFVQKGYQSVMAIPYDIPIVGINYGHVGFLAALKTNELSLLNALAYGAYSIDTRMMLDAEVTDDKGNSKGTFTVLNDIVLTNGPVARLITFDVYCNKIKIPC